jgi:tRNA threonylcarbamoyladenosine biosynthesis protein TsaE
MMKLISTSIKQTQDVGARLAKLLMPGDVLALSGNLGSGKTVFVKGLARGMGCKEKEVLSPTFVLLRQYHGKLTINHFDLYRLKDICQLERIGYEEYFYGAGVTVVEWADRVKEAMPKENLRVEFKTLSEERRLIQFIPSVRRYADYLRHF